jgi:hypothetical protein
MLVRQAFSRARRHTQLPALRPHHFPRSTCERDAFVTFECSPAAVRDPDLADLDRLVACFDHLVPYRYEPGANQTRQHSAREVCGRASHFPAEATFSRWRRHHLAPPSPMSDGRRRRLVFRVFVALLVEPA